MDMRGWWFIAGNLYRDLAALNNAEMLPWDDWGNMPQPDADIPEDRMVVFDEIAAVTSEPDRCMRDLGRLYTDPRFFVPDVVYNAVRQTTDPINLE
jgi:hypothetical protein